jgi:hypothetical protein
LGCRARNTGISKQISGAAGLNPGLNLSDLTHKTAINPVTIGMCIVSNPAE